MRNVAPSVHVVARTVPDYAGMAAYLEDVGGQDWISRLCSSQELALSGDGCDLVEFAGRMCYRSWKPGLNPNITRVRAGQAEYLDNILRQRHGSVLEHVSYSFVFHGVSRVFTHELVRHRPGTAVSQESLRFVRLDDLPFWLPDWAAADEELAARVTGELARLEELQQWMAAHFGLDRDGVTMAEKKARTSFMRRLAPEGVATGLLWTANLRALRHVIAERTSPGAEEEIRLVFGIVARIMQAELPAVFGDFKQDENGTWTPGYPKV